MTDVVIAGVGQIPVGEQTSLSLREMAVEAILAARHEVPDLEPDSLFIGNSLGSMLSHQSNLGSLIADWSNMVGVEGTTAEAGGASGGAALRLGYLAVKSGYVNVAVVVGVEKVTDTDTHNLDRILAYTMDSDHEAFPGLTPAGQAGLIMRRYMEKYGVPPGAFAGFPINAHANAVGNPNAMYRKAISREAYDRASPVSDPLNLMDVAPVADGAAALVITRRELLPKNYPHPLVRVSGSSIVTDTLALHDRANPDEFRAAILSTERALAMSGKLLKDIDLFELDDAFSIYAALALEAAGFAAPGRGWELAQDGGIILKGRIPVCTQGGSKARGNPVGATGVYQVVEAVQQLRGTAGDNQVKNARVALVQCWGGPASTVATHLLERI